MLTAAAPELLHAVGYLTGATLYAMLLVMVVRASRPDHLMLGTALLGLAWNVGEFLAQGLQYMRFEAGIPWLHAASYSAVGVLAMVVIHSVARRQPDDRVRRAHDSSKWIPTAAYTVAGAAAVIHGLAAVTGHAVPSRAALVLVTTGVVIFAGALLVTTPRQPQRRRALWMTALTLFAVSAMHLGAGHNEQESLPLELLGHHASVPLAFAILYEDYRFALADLFLKRALTLLALVSVILAAWSVVPHGATDSVASEGALLALWLVTALSVPLLRRGVAAFVDRFVLRRTGASDVMERVSTALEHDKEDALLDGVCAALAPALSATGVSWVISEDEASSRLGGVAVLTADLPRYHLVVGPLAGGRRLLSDDLTLLERTAFLTARRIDALRLTDERYERMLREREMQSLATEAELRALRAQINPHFLFNALTTIGYLIQQAPPRALDTLMRLTMLLRSVLRSEGEFTTLAHEHELLEAYLQIEHERFEERLDVQIDIPGELGMVQLPSLIVQPLVENAIKHGIAPARNGGRVHVEAQIESSRRPLSGGPSSRIDSRLRIRVHNTGAPLTTADRSESNGVGLHNVERRLRCYYGGEASLTLTSDPSGGTMAELRIPVSDDDVVPASVRATAASA